jgi:hypothetical protein
MWIFSFRRIFKNRWWTLAWAALVCWQAVDYVGSRAPEKPDEQATKDAAALQAAADAMSGGAG